MTCPSPSTDCCSSRQQYTPDVNATRLRKLLRTTRHYAKIAFWEVSINLIDFDVGTIFADPRYRRPSQWSAEARHRYVRHLLKRLLLPLLSLLLVTAAITLGFLLPWAYRLFVVSLWYSAYSLMILYTFHVVVWKQREHFFMMSEVPIVVIASLLIALLESGIATVNQQTAWAVGNSVFGIYIMLGLPLYVFATAMKSNGSDMNSPVRVIGAEKEDTSEERRNEAAAEQKNNKSPSGTWNTYWHSHDHEGLKYFADNIDPVSSLALCVSFAAAFAGIALSWISYVLDRQGSYWHYQIIWLILTACTIKFAQQDKLEMSGIINENSKSMPRIARSVALVTLYVTILLHTPAFLGHFVTYIFSTLGLASVTQLQSSYVHLQTSTTSTVEETGIGIFSSLWYIISLQLYTVILEKAMDSMCGSQAFPRLLFVGQAYYYYYFYMVTAGSSDTPVWMFLFNTVLMNTNYILSGTGSYYEIFKHVYQAYKLNSEEETEEESYSTYYGCLINALKTSAHRGKIAAWATKDALIGIFTTRQTEGEKNASSFSQSEPVRGRTATEDDITYKVPERATPSGSIQALIYLIRMAEQDTLADISTLLVAPATITILSVLKDKQPRLGAPDGYGSVDTFSVWCRFITMAVVRTLSARIMRRVFSRKVEMLVTEEENTAEGPEMSQSTCFHRRLMERRKSLTIVKPRGYSDKTDPNASFTEALNKAAKHREVKTDGLFGLQQRGGSGTNDRSFGPDSPFYSATMQRFDECFPYFVVCFLMVICVCLQTPGKPLRYSFLAI